MFFKKMLSHPGFVQTGSSAERTIERIWSFVFSENSRFRFDWMRIWVKELLLRFELTNTEKEIKFTLLSLLCSFFFFCFLTFPSSRFLIYRKIRQNHLILWLNCLFFIIDGMRYNNDVAKIPRGVCLFSGSGTFIIIGSFNPSYLSLC
jgi:hypothetical protein